MLTRNDQIDVLPLFIRRDLAGLSDFVQRTPHLSKPRKIEALRAIEQLRTDLDDPEAVQACLKVLGI